MPIKKCLYCNKKFNANPHNAGKYCSRDCMNKHFKIIRKGICFNTGKTHFKKGHPVDKETTFRKGHIPWNKGTKGLIIKSKKAHSFPNGNKHPRWKGGKFLQDGYWYIKKPNHPFAHKGYIKRSRFVVEKYLGRYLKPTEIVHHINKITTDDRIKNLMLFKNSGYHRNFHRYKTNKGIILNGSYV